MPTHLRPSGAPSPSCLLARSTSTTALYASNGQAVSFARHPADRLLQRSAVAACLGWEGPHAPLGLSAPALRWLSRAQDWAQHQGILLTPPAAMAMELHEFAEAYCVPRVGRAAQRSLADSLSVESFASTWPLALRQELTQSSFDARCMTWALTHHAALVDADVFGQLERNDPEAHSAWVAAALLRMANADACAWRLHETAFVWTLRRASQLELSYAKVALPEARQVAHDDLRVYRQWVWEHPIWADVPAVVRRWAGDKVCDRNDYLLHLLEEGVPASSFAALTALLAPRTRDLTARLYRLLPVYAKRGDVAALTWLMARPSNTMWPPIKRSVHSDACLEALRADRPDALRYLLKTLSSTDQLLDLLIIDPSYFAGEAARWSPQGMRVMLAALEGCGLQPRAEHVIMHAVASGHPSSVEAILAMLSPSQRYALLASCDRNAPLACALQRGDVAMVRWLLEQLDDRAATQTILLRHLAEVASPMPWDTAQQAEATWRRRLATLLEALPWLDDADMRLLTEPLIAPFAKTAARLGDYGAIVSLLASRPQLQWRQHCFEPVLSAWVADGANLTRLRAIFASIPREAALRHLRSNAVKLAQKAVGGGDTATLQWIIDTVTPPGNARRALYRQAIDHGASLLEAATRGHVAMVRFWLEDFESGTYGPVAVAYADYAIIESAAAAGEPRILDMALAHIQEPGKLDTIMANERGANAIAFAIQHRHHDMLRKLLALPLSDQTRSSILFHDNSPMHWAERGDIGMLQAFLAWAPSSYRQAIAASGLNSAIIRACTADHLALARFALDQGDEAAKSWMLAAQQGRLVPFAAARGDVIILEQARRLLPPFLIARQHVPNQPPPT